MQRRASSWYGPTIARVGQMSMQARASAAMSRSRAASTGSGRSVKISPRKNHEPALAVEQIGVLADPAEPGIARERFLEHRCAVDERAIADEPTAARDAIGELVRAAARSTL